MEFRETAIEGYADSQYMLSFMLLDGTDVKRRSAQAYVWASLAKYRASSRLKSEMPHR